VYNIHPPFTGLPLTLALIKRNATVTICHSHTPQSELVRLCKDADFLFVAAGHPHLVDSSMVKPAAVVINIGTTYCEEDGTLQPDVNPNVTAFARVMTPTPHGVGSLPVAMLCHNTLVLAEAKARAKEAVTAHVSVPSGWAVSHCDLAGSPYLGRVVKCKDFAAAVNLLSGISKVSDRLNHHVTASINSKRECQEVSGCELHVQVSTYSTKAITELDILLASEIDKLLV
jgi:pterin-4a-carbinolamine dehydratase